MCAFEHFMEFICYIFDGKTLNFNDLTQKAPFLYLKAIK
jgi:hypothetical protein